MLYLAVGAFLRQRKGGTMHDQVSTGLIGLDRVIDKLRLGDNVVFKVDSLDDYRKLVALYVAQALKDKRSVIYIRFAIHAPLIDEGTPVKVYEVRAGKGL